MHDLAWHELSARLALTLMHFLWQGVLVALAIFALLRNLKRNSRARYAVALGGLFVMATLPVVTLCVVDTPEEWWRSETAPKSTLRIATNDVQDGSPTAALAESPAPAVPPGSQGAPAVAPAQPVSVTMPTDMATALAALAPSANAPASSPPVWIAATPWVATAYFAGVLLMFVRVALGIRGNHRLRRYSRPIGDAAITARLRERAAALRLRITPALAVCEQIAVPTVIGVLRPLILLPASLVSGLPLDQLDAVLTHELAHIRRWDPVVNFLQRLVEAVLFFHPGVWYVSRKVRETREHCCDDLVVSLGVSPVEYATSLLDVAERAVRSPLRRSLPRPAAALQATGQRSQLGGRVRRLLGADEPESLRVRHPGFVLMLVITVSLGLTSAALNSRAAPKPETPEAAEEPARYEVTLPNGATVRLLGVTEYPHEGKPWWTADGTPCDPVPGKINTTSTYDGPPVISRLIVLEATGLPADCRTEAVLTPTKSSAIGNDRAGAGPHRVTFIGRFDPATQTAEADFKFASGTWTSAAQFDRDGKPLGTATGVGREITFEEVKSGDGSWGQTEMTFNVPDEFGDVRIAWRAHVVSTNGQQHKSVHDQWGKQGDEDRTRYRLGFDVLRDQIERIVVETDSFVFGVRFSGISLHPGQKTDVKIGTEVAGVLPREVFADMVADTVLKRAQWPHLAERRSSLSREQAAAEFRELVTKFAPRELPRERRESLLAAIERQMQTDGWRNAPADDLDYHDWCYLHAPELLHNLQWRLYLALIREPLTPEQQQRLNQQRDWMRKYVRGLPAVDPGFRDKTHEAVLQALEDKFADPLCPAFHEPLADDRFAALQTEIESLDRTRGLIFIEHHLTWEAARGLMRSDAAEVPVPELTGFRERAQSFSASNGVLRVEFPSTNFHKGMPNNLSDYRDGNIIVSQPAYIMLWGGVPQETIAAGLDPIRAYCADNNVGDFLFDAENRRLVALRGAKLLALPTGKTTRWYDIDELPTDRLRNIIRQDGDAFFALPEAVSVSNIGEERLHQYVGLLLPDERVLVIHLNQLAFGQLSLRVRAHESSTEPAPQGQSGNAGDAPANTRVRIGDAASALTSESTGRMLTFPADHPVGQISIRRVGPMQVPDIREWESLGFAQATVAIPADHEVKLHVSTRGALDLSFLDDLPVNALHTLDLNDTGVEDDQLRHIRRLTGLRSLQMQGNEITDRGIEDLRPLADLEVLKLSKFGSTRNISDDALAVVAALPNLKQLDLRMTQVGDAGMAAIAGMTQLTCLDVSGTKVTDEGLRHVGRLAGMEYLDLGIYSDEGIPCTDAGLAHLSGLTHLRWLRLAGSKVTDAGLKHLSGMKNLQHLSLGQSGVTNAGLALLSPLEALEELWLPRTLDDEGCLALARLKKLREIVGDTDSVTDAGVVQLATLAYLERLTLEGDGITDRSLAALKQSRQLKWLHLYDTSVTDSGLAMLREMPQLELLRIRGHKQTETCIPHVAQLPRLMLLTLSLNEDRDNAPPMDLSPLAAVGTLRILELDGPSAQGVNLDPVAGLPLERLIIEAPIGNRELEIIGRISTLNHLEVGGAEITNEGLLHLAELHQLEILALRGSFDDAGLSQLQGLPRLRHAQFSARGVTEKGIAELLAACPSLQRASTFGSE